MRCFICWKQFARCDASGQRATSDFYRIPQVRTWITKVTSGFEFNLPLLVP